MLAVSECLQCRLLASPSPQTFSADGFDLVLAENEGQEIYFGQVNVRMSPGGRLLPMPVLIYDNGTLAEDLLSKETFEDSGERCEMGHVVYFYRPVAK